VRTRLLAGVPHHSLRSVSCLRWQYSGSEGAGRQDVFLRSQCGLHRSRHSTCGTPVVAMHHGSVPEVVADGRTGFICRSIGEMIASVGKVDRLDRRACRVHVAERFSVERMVDGYEAAYRRLEAPIVAVHRAVEEPVPVAMFSFVAQSETLS
jgi:hypothetical protein